jgi:DNA-binding Xre family transcriptional regulator
MIKNEKQFNITKKKLAEVNELITKENPLVSKSLQKELYVTSLIRIKNQMQNEVNQYEKTKHKGISLKRKISITKLPDILIEYKISKKLSQKDFSAILGIKEQQLQRYEAEHYATVSFRRLLEFVEKTNLNITLAVEENT